MDDSFEITHLHVRINLWLQLFGKDFDDSVVVLRQAHRQTGRVPVCDCKNILGVRLGSVTLRRNLSATYFAKAIAAKNAGWRCSR